MRVRGKTTVGMTANGIGCLRQLTTHSSLPAQKCLTALGDGVKGGGIRRISRAGRTTATEHYRLRRAAWQTGQKNVER